jgi:GT2 family glycosyltransferase
MRSVDSGEAMKEKSYVDVSVIIVNWNTCDLLRQCLLSVFTPTLSIDFEVIVVDNGSTDGSVEMVRREFGQVKILANEGNRGFAAANNQAIAIANGRYILLLNSDTIILDRAIEKTVIFADSHPDTATTGCRILNPDRTLQSSCFMFPSILNWFLFSTYLYRLFPRNRFFGRERMTWWLRDDSREVDVVTGCYMLVRREAIDQVGQMDEQFFMYAEETDWCYRFKAKGWKNRFTPSAEIIHIGGASAAKLGPRRAAVTNRSFVRYMFKHWSAPRASIGVFMIILFYMSRLAVLVPKLWFKPGVNDKLLFENHWAGLKDMLVYTMYHKL